MGKRSKGKTKQNRKSKKVVPETSSPQQEVSRLKNLYRGGEDGDVSNPEIVRQKLRPVGGGRKVEPTRWRANLGPVILKRRKWIIEDPRQNRIYTAAKNALKKKRGGFIQEVTLWHGTTEDAVISILEGHFCLPRKRGMFGKGLYFGDRQKATGYAWGAILCCRVLLGRTFVADNAMRDLDADAVEAMDYDSVHGKAGHTLSWGGTLRLDEWVIYHPGRVKIIRIEET